jgi:hypothetical protein
MYQLNNDMPCAYVTKNRQRIKQFGDNVYLKDGSEFELELYNPSRKTVLSKVKINGTYITGGGIVLRPGERVFLERYLDDPRKFKFETYHVDGSVETQNAIAENGDVEIEFYNEKESIPTLNLNYNPLGGLLNVNNTYGTCVSTYYNTGIGNGGLGYKSTTVTSTTLGSNKENGFNNLRSKKLKSSETGRVEKGSNSDQSFKTVNKEFEYLTISKSYWKILPESQKKYEIKDIVSYCSNCGSKRKKTSHKFCPTCGEKF